MWADTSSPHGFTPRAVNNYKRKVSAQKLPWQDSVWHLNVVIKAACTFFLYFVCLKQLLCQIYPHKELSGIKSLFQSHLNICMHSNFSCSEISFDTAMNAIFLVITIQYELKFYISKGLLLWSNAHPMYLLCIIHILCLNCNHAW